MGGCSLLTGSGLKVRRSPITVVREFAEERVGITQRSMHVGSISGVKIRDFTGWATPVEIARDECI